MSIAKTSDLLFRVTIAKHGRLLFSSEWISEKEAIIAFTDDLNNDEKLYRRTGLRVNIETRGSGGAKLNQPVMVE